MPTSVDNTHTSPRISRLRWRGSEWFRWFEFILRGVVFFVCLVALILPIIISVTIKHNLGISYAAAVYGLIVNGIELVLLYLEPQNNDASFCFAWGDFLAIPLFAFGSVGAFADGGDWSGDRPLDDAPYEGPLPVPEGWLLAGAA
ncbi:hypothetical protein G7Y89_g8485 [Cudoniella acicularis]|uniref:Uncharacterized protein n=1 Tax=Cudoniella acicularis TaxID=354080 RepID=A0A8H4RGI6_9HELO|nr:hypothetical protein G7Y89_g8485 [Cudoniella acicularis]